jgi:hypothetical protein
MSEQVEFVKAAIESLELQLAGQKKELERLEAQDSAQTELPIDAE